MTGKIKNVRIDSKLFNFDFIFALVLHLMLVIVSFIPASGVENFSKFYFNFLLKDSLIKLH